MIIINIVILRVIEGRCRASCVFLLTVIAHLIALVAMVEILSAIVHVRINLSASDLIAKSSLTTCALSYLIGHPSHSYGLLVFNISSVNIDVFI